MSVWTTKALDRPREYIVIKHTLPGINYSINGVKFRSGYAVVEKASKVYLQLKKIPVLTNAKEFPLTTLRKLPFITRTADIMLIFGRDVYNEYLKAIAPVIKQEENVKIQEAITEHIATGGCTYLISDGRICGNNSLEYSPSNFCTFHLIEDPLIEQFGIKKPKYMTKQERKDFKEKVVKVLESNKKAVKNLKTVDLANKVTNNGDKVE